MQPNGPQPAPPPYQPQGGQNNYSFITDPAKAGKKSLLPSGGSKKNRIIIMVGGLFALITLGVVVFSIINSIGSDAKADWLTLAQKQQEIIRVSDIGAAKAQTRAAKNLSATTSLSLKSTQLTVNGLAKKNGAIITTKSLALGVNIKTDAALKTAEQTNQFDDAFQNILKTELNEYQALLKKLHDGTSSKSTKAGLSSAYNNAGILATQANR